MPATRTSSTTGPLCRSLGWAAHAAAAAACACALALRAHALRAQPPRAPAPAPATAPNAADSSLLTLDRLFASPEFFPRPFGPVRWTSDGAAYTTLEPARDSALAARGGLDLVRHDASSGRRTVVVSAERLVPPGSSTPMTVEGYIWSPDGRHLLVFTNTARVWRDNTRGDYWVLDTAGGSLRKLGGPAAAPSSLMFAKFSPDGGRVAYVRANNLYVEELAGGTVRQLTVDGSRTTLNGTFDWVHEEEFALRDGFRWSPDGQRIAYWQLDASGVRDFLLLNTTDSLYSFTVPVQYPKAGTTNSAARVGVVSAGGGATRWLDIPGDPRQRYLARMDWAANSDELVVQRLDRRQQALDVVLGDARTGAVRPVLAERDSTWVDPVNDLRWLDGGRRFTWMSERDGWRRLYAVPRAGGAPRPLTPAGIDLQEPGAAFGAPYVLGVDSARGWVYFRASPGAPTQLALYRARLDGRGGAERVTPAGVPGVHRYEVAPGARWAIHSYSTFDTPPVTELVRLPEHTVVRVLEENAELRRRVAALRRGPSEFLRLRVADGTPLDAWLMKPADFDSTRRYPVLFHVYGEPWGQTVLDWWSGATYLWHLLLTQRGYLVASVDNRGTPAPRGRAWRKSVYGQIGVIASRDQTDAVRALVRHPYVDSTRVGVWGWSGGGSMTLNLMFRSPTLYRMGMAVAPVSDGRDYDTIYQERYMGLPAENAAGYRASAPLTHAANLRGHLLVVHGTGDDNVHYQGTERLVNALVAAGRPFTMMAYPNRSHCICEGEGTTRHLFGLLTRYLEEHLPAGPAPRAATAAVGR